MLPSELLFKICFLFSCTVPDLKKVQPKSQTLPSPQWAHLDTEEFQEIFFVCADNPHHLFVRLSKFNDR
jgi:hypothetical protein